MAYDEFTFGDGDPASVTDRMLADYAARQPGWLDLPGDPIGAMFRAVALQIDVLRDLVADTFDAAFSNYGRTVIGVPAPAEAKATMSMTVLFADPFGRTLREGLAVVYVTDEGTELEFATVAQVSVPTGQSSVTLTVAAAHPGSDYNGVPVGAELQILDDVAGITAVTAATVSAGGTDAEDEDAYRDLLADALGTLHLAVSNEHDAAVLARTVPGVHRAYAEEAGDMEVVIYALDETGAQVGAEVREAMLAYLGAPERRTVNVLLSSGPVTYTPVVVEFTARAMPGFTPSQVEQVAEQAVRDVLDPSVFSGGRAQPPEWRGDNVVRYLDVANAIGRVPGVDSLQTLTLNGAAEDVQLAGSAPLPASFTREVDPSSVAGTVVAP